MINIKNEWVMVIRVNYLRGLKLPTASALYKLIAELNVKAIDEILDDEGKSLTRRWRCLVNNFDITFDDILKDAEKYKKALRDSIDNFPSINLDLSIPQINTLISIFFIIEPDLIEKNTEIVQDLWDIFYDWFSKNNNNITFLNITKI